jgi:hypothetical protein
MKALSTAGQRWRFKRNLSIYLARKGGASVCMLADAHDLAESRVRAILEEVKANGEARQRAASPTQPPSPEKTPWPPRYAWRRRRQPGHEHTSIQG